MESVLPSSKIDELLGQALKYQAKFAFDKMSQQGPHANFGASSGSSAQKLDDDNILKQSNGSDIRDSVSQP